ncbi:BTB/POZ domain-containing protein FBL11-like isoform X2 [Silene latifolia]|uniref:BTB/POZ domain-containing protein FBL11-like isoform X2 n=1 Tax=Silene latifolia TaxID=37657 RepID=UPI003D77DB8C
MATEGTNGWWWSARTPLSSKGHQIPLLSLKLPSLLVTFLPGTFPLFSIIRLSKSTSFALVLMSLNYRLIEESTYFRTLFAGNFSESSMCSISVYWNPEMFIPILRFIHGYHMEITIFNFLPLFEAALYFGLERLVVECKTWFCDIMLKERLSSQQLRLDDVVRFRDFGLEHAVDWVVEHCTSYVAKNFMWAMSCDIFVDVPYSFILACVKHPHLTVYSERHLCETLLAWSAANMETSGFEDVWTDKCNQKDIQSSKWPNIFEEIRVDLLPLWFIMGKCRCSYFSTFAKQGVPNTFGLLKGLPKDSHYLGVADDFSYARIRLTEYSQKLDLSGCPQITTLILLLSLLRPSDGPLLLDAIRTSNIDLEYPKWLSLFPILSFEAMAEVDISKCSLLHLGAAVDCFKKSFPLLRTIRMAQFLDFETIMLCNLVENSTIREVDLTVDVSPLLPSKVSVLHSESVSRPTKKRYYNISPHREPKPWPSNISKLTLEGRTDFSDAELLDVAECCASLIYLNIRGCLSVTDIGIANLIVRCAKLHSIIATNTSFGGNSISALCSRAQGTANSPFTEVDVEHVKISDINLQMLHIGGCKGVCETSLVNILSKGRMLKSLCLRDTCLVDHALYRFLGSALEMLDVSNTMISRDALLYMVMKNPGLEYLETSGCRNLCLHGKKNSEDNLASWYPCEKIFSMLGKECRLEKLAIGWGFSDSSVHAIGPGLKSLKNLKVGLGGSLGPEGMNLLCTLCPLLESVSITFQVISDIAIMKLLVTLKSLRALSIRYCIGDISQLALNCKAPHLRKLKLERVTPWMTNDNLALLTQNCVNLIELSLVGCTCLDGDAQEIISSGWPGLVCLHLEDCGLITSKGVGALFDCKAMEDLLLRHNGCGIWRNFIIHAASKLPMLRSLSLDWCDASEGDLDLPNFTDRYSLSNVKISRCKLRKCSLDFHNIKAQKRPVHKETLVLLWNSRSLQRTVVKERIT